MKGVIITARVTLFLLILFTFHKGYNQESSSIIFKDDFTSGTGQWIVPAIKQLSLETSGGKLSINNSSEEEAIIQGTGIVYPSQNFVATISFTPTYLSENAYFTFLFKDNLDEGYEAYKFFSNRMIVERKINDVAATVGELKKVFSNHSKTSIIIKKSNGTMYLSIDGEQVYSGASKIDHPARFSFASGSGSAVKIDDIEISWTNKSFALATGFDADLKKENMGSSINSPYHDINPVISPSGKTLFFTRKGDPQNEGEGMNDDSWYARASGDGWSTATHFDEKINDKNHNNVSTSVEEEDYFLVLSQYSGEGKDIDDTYALAKRNGNSWSSPEKQKIKGYENESGIISACLSPDGKFMILTLQNESSLGETDLYISEKIKNNVWSEPENLGAPINTIGREMTPFISPNGRKMYFSSDGHGGYGSNDIYEVTRKGKSWKRWSSPKNMGPSVNSSAWDAYFTVSKDFDYAYVSSHQGENGGMDIYRIELPDLDPNAPVMVMGYVYDSLTNKPLKAKVTIRDYYDDSLFVELETDPETGYYEYKLNRGRDYSLLAEKDLYNAQKESAMLQEIGGEAVIQRDFYLSKFQVGQKIVLNKIYFFQSLDSIKPESMPELEKLYNILDENPEIRIMIEGHTDNVGLVSSNEKLSQMRTDAIKKWLVEKGISKKRLETKGYGPHRPIASNRSEATRKLNRRVEFLIID